MADTKLKDENAVVAITDGTAVYCEKETSPGNGIWQPFRFTFLQIVTWIGTKASDIKTALSLSKADVGLGNVDNVTDANKPISTATQTALNTKVPTSTTVNGHALNGNISVSKSDVGLGNADNISDINKPISTAQQTALNTKSTVVVGAAGTTTIGVVTVNTRIITIDGTPLTVLIL